MTFVRLLLSACFPNMQLMCRGQHGLADIGPKFRGAACDQVQRLTYSTKVQRGQPEMRGAGD